MVIDLYDIPHYWRCSALEKDEWEEFNKFVDAYIGDRAILMGYEQQLAQPLLSFEKVEKQLCPDAVAEELWELEQIGPTISDEQYWKNFYTLDECGDPNPGAMIYGYRYLPLKKRAPKKYIAIRNVIGVCRGPEDLHELGRTHFFNFVREKIEKRYINWSY